MESCEHGWVVGIVVVQSRTLFRAAGKRRSFWYMKWFCGEQWVKR